MPPRAKAALFDIQHAAIGIEMFTSGKTIQDYNSDLMLRSAVERQFEIIGEAMTRLRADAPDLLSQISEADRIIGFRNVLIHGYDTVNNEITWRIIHEKLPILRKEVGELLK
jgi:uncharacterized protein with HEPN domain